MEGWDEDIVASGTGTVKEDEEEGEEGGRGTAGGLVSTIA